MDVQTFSTGAVRGTDNSHVRYDLISPIGLRRLAETYAEGSKKYSDNNWLKGIPASNLLNHTLAHLNKFLAGDTSEDHLAHAAWNIFTLMHFQETRPDMFEGLPAPVTDQLIQNTFPTTWSAQVSFPPESVVEPESILCPPNDIEITDDEPTITTTQSVLPAQDSYKGVSGITIPDGDYQLFERGITGAEFYGEMRTVKDGVVFHDGQRMGKASAPIYQGVIFKRIRTNQ